MVYMNWVDNHSRVDDGVTLGSCKINRLLVADDLGLLASSEQVFGKHLINFQLHATKLE